MTEHAEDEDFACALILFCGNDGDETAMTYANAARLIARRLPELRRRLNHRDSALLELGAFLKARENLHKISDVRQADAWRKARLLLAAVHVRNPHNCLHSVDAANISDSKRWECHYCHAEGTYDELSAVECSYVPSACTGSRRKTHFVSPRTTPTRQSSGPVCGFCSICRAASSRTETVEGSWSTTRNH